MVQRVPETYRVDPADPRAPSEEEWAAMSPEERARVVAMLPSEREIEAAPEGDQHRIAKNRATETLDAYFRRIKRKIYVSSELSVYYPGERSFSPDVLAVLDVEVREREKWVVATEGKGLDLVIEVHYGGDADKDYKTNVERYARLGIQEYFIFNRAQLSLRGYRLSPAAAGRSPRSYLPILPQEGRYASAVLALDLAVEGTRLRFFTASATVLEADELIGKLGAMLDEVILHKQEAEERAAVETARAEAEAARAEAEAVHAAAERARAEVEAARARQLEQELAEARAEIARLKRGI